MKLGVVTGLLDEAACLAAGVGLSVCCTGPGPERAAQAARALIADGAQVLVSFGVAGSLVRIVQPASLVVPEGLVLPDGRRRTVEPELRADLAARLSGRVHAGLLAGSDRAVLAVAAKQALRQKTGAVAVDMESHAVASVAAEAGRPFLVLRAIVDGADEAVPSLALKGMSDDGRALPGPVARGLLKQPWQLPALVRLGSRMKAALAALRQAAPALAALGAELGGAELGGTER